jgi:photosystem II stability/assembly factor-like uncharacterized protein
MTTFNTLKAMGMALAGSVALFACATSAQTWETVDDFQYVAGSAYNQARAITTDANGSLYVAGEGWDASKLNHGVIMGSSDHGASWVPLDDFLYSTNRLDSYDSTYNALGFDSAQNLYAVAAPNSSITNRHLTVRKSGDLGASWSTVLDFPFTGGFCMAGSPGFAADSTGRIFVGCSPSTPGPLVLKSADAGATWTSLNPFAVNANLNGILSIPAGLFVCGSAMRISGASYPYVMWGNVRKSVDGGTTWTTVDTYNPPGFTGYGFVAAICADPAGNIYVGGWANLTIGKGRSATTLPYCVIRKGTNGGTQWQTIATIPIPGPSIANLSLGFDTAGNFYVGGAEAPTAYGLLRSTDGGSTWNVVDSFPFNPMSFGCDRAGNVYFGGFTSPGTLPEPGGHWLVREQVGP